MKRLLISLLCLFTTSMVFADTATANDIKKSVPAQNISWEKPPRITFTEQDIKRSSRKLMIQIYASEQGLIKKTKVIESSGSPSLDAKIEQAVKEAKLKPYIENGIAYPIIAIQPFVLSLPYKNSRKKNTDDINHECELISQNWLAQEKGQPTSFHYQSKPALTVSKWELADKNRYLNISFKLSKQNKISNVRIIDSNTDSNFNEMVLASIQRAQATAPRKFYQFYKLKFTDRIDFKAQECK